MESFLEIYKKQIDEYIDNKLISISDSDVKITEIMRYSVLGGKRLRGILTMEFGKMLGLSTEDLLPYAMALECVQAYSLIHDDLPCMDNDDYRRGKLSSHKMFGEANAVLGGDALLTHAFTVISNADLSKKYPDRALKAIGILSDYSGYAGMVGGQVLDLEAAENMVSTQKLDLIHSLKTCALIKASVLCGCVAAGAEDTILKSAEIFADSFGHAFQIIDDILDHQEKADEMNSYVMVNGLEKSFEDANAYIEKAKEMLLIFDNNHLNTSNLKELLNFLSKRMGK